MLKFSLKYYLKCIALSIAGYACGGFFIAFIATEGESFLTYTVPIIITIVGVALRILFLNQQIEKEKIISFKSSDYFKMSLPALFLTVLTVILFICDNCLNSADAIPHNVKMYILALYPESFTVNGIIYVLSYWSNTVYYVLLVANILIYLLPIWICIPIRNLLRNNKVNKN